MQVFAGENNWGYVDGVSMAEQDLEKIAWVKEASQAIKPYTVGNYINRESCTSIRPAGTAVWQGSLQALLHRASSP